MSQCVFAAKLNEKAQHQHSARTEEKKTHFSECKTVTFPEKFNSKIKNKTSDETEKDDEEEEEVEKLHENFK